MLKKLIFSLGIIVTTPSLCQYTQSIENLSRNEIKDLILELDDSHQAKQQYKKFKSQQVAGIFLLGVGLAASIAASNSSSPSNRSEVNMGGIFYGSIAAFAAGTGLVVLMSSEEQFKKAKEGFLSSFNPSNKIGWNRKGGIQIFIKDEEIINDAIFN